MSKTNSKPSHEVFAVAERKGQKSHWLKIGACWAHEDGQGFNLKLEALPLNGVKRRAILTPDWSAPLRVDR